MGSHVDALVHAGSHVFALPGAANMDWLKGQGRPILYFTTDQDSFELVAYTDDSLAIWRGGRPLCVWEPDEAEDCLRTFARMSAAAMRSSKAPVDADLAFALPDRELMQPFALSPV